MSIKQSTDTIVQYVEKHGGKSFWVLPFSDVDSLVFSTIVYADLEISPFGKIANFNCTIAELEELVQSEKLSEYMWNHTKGAKLLTAAAKSKRFGNILMHDYVRYIDPDKQKQFTAITFSLNTDFGYVDYIAYQGTDDTWTGWREDFNMTYSRHVPAQREAVVYLHRIANESDNKLILGGHSKGGNLAVYAGIKAPRELKPRIIAVYDHDGPGFLPDTFTAMERRNIVDRIHKTVPESAVFGLMLDDEVKTRKVVYSNAKVIMQHDPLTWVVDGTEFATAPSTNAFSRSVERMFQQWLRGMTAEQRQQFAEGLNNIMSGTIHDTKPGLRLYMADNWSVLLKQVRTTKDPIVREQLMRMLNLFAKCSWQELKSMTASQLGKILHRK